MARPKTPLISENAVVEAATRILEREGPKALTLRRLGMDLKVNSASLYHHFHNKDDILLAVIRHALRDMKLPPMDDEWEKWIAENAVFYHRLLIAKPFLIPLMLDGIRPRTLAYSVSDTKLAEAGVPDNVRPEFIHILDTTTVGLALAAINAPRGAGGRGKLQFDHESMLRKTIRMLIHDMVKQYGTDKANAVPA